MVPSDNVYIDPSGHLNFVDFESFSRHFYSNEFRCILTQNSSSGVFKTISKRIEYAPPGKYTEYYLDGEVTYICNVYWLNVVVNVIVVVMIGVMVMVMVMMMMVTFLVMMFVS